VSEGAKYERLEEIAIDGDSVKFFKSELSYPSEEGRAVSVSKEEY